MGVYRSRLMNAYEKMMEGISARGKRAWKASFPYLTWHLTPRMAKG